MPMDQIATCFRTRLDLFSARDIIEEYFTSIYNIKDLFSTTASRAQLIHSFFSDIYNENIAYTHMNCTSMTDYAGAHVKTVYPLVNIAADFVLCCGMNFKNDVSLIIMSKFKDDRFYENICHELDALNISYRLEDAALAAHRYFTYETD